MPKRLSIFDPPVDEIDPDLDPYQVRAIQQYLQDNNIGFSTYGTGRNSPEKIRTRLYERMLKNNEYKRMAPSRSYSNADINNYPQDFDKTKAYYEYPSGEVKIFKESGLAHENFHANAPTGISPYLLMQQYMKGNTGETLRSGAFKWVNALINNREYTSSVQQALENGRPAAVEEMLAEIAGNNFKIPKGIFEEIELKAIEEAIRNRYKNKPFSGITLE